MLTNYYDIIPNRNRHFMKDYNYIFDVHENMIEQKCMNASM